MTSTSRRRSDGVPSSVLWKCTILVEGEGRMMILRGSLSGVYFRVGKLSV